MLTHLQDIENQLVWERQDPVPLDLKNLLGI